MTITFEPFTDSFSGWVAGGTGAYEHLHGTGSGTGTPQQDYLLDRFTGACTVD